MRTIRTTATAIAGLAMIASIAITPSVVHAQDPFCDLLSPKEVRRLYGDKVVAESSNPGCMWHSNDDKGPFVNVDAGWVNLTLG